MSTGPALRTESPEDTGLLRHLVQARLAGDVNTPPAASRHNTARLLAGDPDYTFGLSDWREADEGEVLSALRALGCSLADDPADDGPEGYIEPTAALAGIRTHGRELAAAAAGGSDTRVLVATGHPSALLGHYAELARALAAAGCRLLRPLDGRKTALRTPEGQACGIRYVDGVGALSYAGGLHHTHRAHYMEALLDDLGGGAVDLVVADHGFAGAAIEAGVPTLSIADVNDPALPLAQLRGRTSGVLLIDDGLEPALFAPVTAAMRAWSA